MISLSCPQIAEMVEEIALDNLSGEWRGAALDHLARCTTCRMAVEELTSTADAVLLACPSVEPPPGFEHRVMTAIRQRRRRHRPRLLALAVGAAAVLALGGGGSVALRTLGRTPPDPAPAGTHELRTVMLTARDGRVIGDVSAYQGRPAWFFMRVDRGKTTATYRCVLDVDGGRSIVLGELVVTNGRGAWGQHIGLDAHSVRAARLVDAKGATVATALLQ